MNASTHNTAPQQLVIASQNPVKVNATLSGFCRSFPGCRFTAVGIRVDSGVSDQPTSDEETRLGAVQRAAAAQHQRPEADYWVGIEGGLETIAGQMMAFAWVVIHSAE
jgi:inosine/xanthosine triphosphatase